MKRTIHVSQLEYNIRTLLMYSILTILLPGALVKKYYQEIIIASIFILIAFVIPFLIVCKLESLA